MGFDEISQVEKKYYYLLAVRQGQWQKLDRALESSISGTTLLPLKLTEVMRPQITSSLRV